MDLILVFYFVKLFVLIVSFQKKGTVCCLVCCLVCCGYSGFFVCVAGTVSFCVCVAGTVSLLVCCRYSVLFGVLQVQCVVWYVVGTVCCMECFKDLCVVWCVVGTVCCLVCCRYSVLFGVL